MWGRVCACSGRVTPRVLPRVQYCLGAVSAPSARCMTPPKAAERAHLIRAVGFLGAVSAPLRVARPPKKFDGQVTMATQGGQVGYFSRLYFHDKIDDS